MVRRTAPRFTPAQTQVLDQLVASARRARDFAYAPYSRFLVGAALLCDDGTVIPGCNVENASYGLCMCAERNAIGTAVGEGRRKAIAIAIVTASDPPSPPCGMCRQVLAEYAGGEDFVVVLENLEGKRVVTSVHALLPMGFNPAMLASGAGPGAREGKGKGKGKGKGTGQRARS